MKSAKEEPIKTITSRIRSGIKVIEVDQRNHEIKFIECVSLEGEKIRPYYKTVPVKERALFDKLLASKQFKNALFNPQDRGILLIDVAGYSKHDTLYQASILSLFNQAIKQALKKFRTRIGTKCLEQIIPTGDGCYFIFNPCVNDYFFKVAYTLFVEMNKVQDQLIGKYGAYQNTCEQMHLRYSCIIGETDFFYDPAGRRNCYGTGMNEAERVLKLGQSGLKEVETETMDYDSIFLDKSTLGQAGDLIRMLELKNQHPVLEDLGEVNDKHDITRNIYWLHNLPPLEDIEI